MGEFQGTPGEREHVDEAGYARKTGLKHQFRDDGPWLARVLTGWYDQPDSSIYHLESSFAHFHPFWGP
ncbi:MAG TPA: hypothetical protein VK425_07030 [Acidimicrobiales bacterium]|nr:hypothetical protein [Acidimicrobiales bacterium]